MIEFLFLFFCFSLIGLFVYVLFVIITEPEHRHRTTEEDRESLELLMEKVREGRKTIDAQAAQEEPEPKKS